MKKIALMALAAAASAIALAPSAHAAPDPGPATSTSTVSLTVPPTITFTAGNVSYNVPDPTQNQIYGDYIYTYLTTNYHTVSLSVKAGQAGTTRTTAAAVILAGDITVNSTDGAHQLTTTDAPFGSLTGFSPNVPAPYKFPVAINNPNLYERGTYTNTVLITATGS